MSLKNNATKTRSAEVDAYDTWEMAIDKLSELGFDHLPVDYPPLGEWTRVPSAFKDANNSSASIMVTPDGKAVHLYDFVEGTCHSISGNSLKSLSAFEKRRRIAEAEIKRCAVETEKRKRNTDAICKAKKIFECAEPCTQHRYLETKCVDLPGCRTDGFWLLIPLTDVQDNLQSLQRIAPDGTKRLIAGAPIKGAAYRIGSIDPTGTVYVTEGAATGASLYHETGEPVVCAMAAGNLLTVAKGLRQQYQKVKIVIAGDDDKKSSVNIGRKTALLAAQAVDGYILLPSFCESCDGNCTDHNDVANCKRSQ